MYVDVVLFSNPVLLGTYCNQYGLHLTAECFHRKCGHWVIHFTRNAWQSLMNVAFDCGLFWSDVSVLEGWHKSILKGSTNRRFGWCDHCQPIINAVIGIGCKRLLLSLMTCSFFDMIVLRADATNIFQRVFLYCLRFRFFGSKILNYHGKRIIISQLHLYHLNYFPIPLSGNCYSSI